MSQTKPTLSLTPASSPKPVDPRLQVGDPVPMFRCASNVNPNFDFATTAGRYLVLSFFGSTAHPVGSGLIETFRAAAETFADPDFYFFGVSCDPSDRDRPSLRDMPPGMDIFWDLDR